MHLAAASRRPALKLLLLRISADESQAMYQHK
jgi:hypothetical protein